MKKLRVIIADDSLVCRELLREIVEAEGDILVVGEAEDGASAVARVAEARPDLLMLDVEMPHLDGLRAVERIMAATPVPILIVTARDAARRTSTAFEAVERGALDLVGKPAAMNAAEGAALRATVRRLAAITVVRHVGLREARATIVELPRSRDLRVVGIGASAGGPSAVAALLSRLPRDFPACVIVVQHMLTGFVDAFADFLRTQTPLAVEVVRGPVPWRAATVFVAAEGSHLVARSHDVFSPIDSAPVEGHRPAADVLLQSLATVYGRNAAGVVLSGIGRDGTRGLLAMKTAGALTFAQDEATSPVFGMPRSAKESGAADHVYAPVDIARFIALAAAAPKRSPA